MIINIQVLLFTLIFLILIILFLILTQYTHPITLIFFIIIYTILICLNISIWKKNYLYSIILFLIIIRGLLIIFLYFASLISNEQFFFSIKNSYFFYLSIFILNLWISFYLFLINNNFLNNHFFYIFKESLNLNSINNINFKNILNLYEYPYNNLTILCIFYLLITLFSIIKICSFKFFTFRKIN